MKLLSAFIVTLLLLSSCSKFDMDDSPKEFSFEFKDGASGWTGGFADYPRADSSIFELEFIHAKLPSPLDQSQGALLSKGTNRSDDLFMYIKKKISGLEASRSYTIDFDIEIATDAASGGVGVGGAPGESVYIKAGATAIEPLAMYDDSTGYFVMNIDKGNQAQEGKDMMVIGDFANGTSKYEYKLKTLKNTKTITAKSDAEGALWIIVGTDSGFESTTAIYYNNVTLKLTAK